MKPGRRSLWFKRGLRDGIPIFLGYLAVSFTMGIAAKNAGLTALQAQKNIVMANAAFAIQVLEKGKKSIEECIDIARESLDSGKALSTFRRFVEINS